MALKETTLAQLPDGETSELALLSQDESAQPIESKEPAAVTVAGKKMSLAQIESLANDNQSLTTKLAEFNQHLPMIRVLEKLSPEAMHLAIDRIEEILSSQTTGQPLTNVLINGFDPREDFEQQSQKDMTDGELTVLGKVFDLQTDVYHKYRELVGYLQGIRADVDKLLGHFGDQLVMQQFGVSAEIIADLRASGVSDIRTYLTRHPVKRPNPVAREEAEAEEAIEAPMTEGRELDWANMSQEQMGAAYLRGNRPKDKDLLSRLEDAYGTP